MTKSDIRLAEERVKRLEKEVELFQTWFDKGGELREKILKKMRNYQAGRLVKYNRSLARANISQ